jgi:predicted transcriptional regulator
METVHRILQIFVKNEVQIISKRQLMDEIKSWNLEVSFIRDAWHTLMGNGLIQQNGDEVHLTEKGSAFLKTQ